MTKTVREKALQPAALLRSLRSHVGEMSAIVFEHDGSTWVTNAYWMVRLQDDTLTAVTELWAQFNLPLEPMRFTVGLGIRRQQQPTSDGREPAKILDALTKPECAISPVPTPDGVLYVRPAVWGRLTGTLVLWRRDDGQWVRFDERFAGFVRLFGTFVGADESWYQSADSSPAWCFDGKRPVAGLMPVRCDPLFDVGMPEVRLAVCEVPA